MTWTHANLATQGYCLATVWLAGLAVLFAAGATSAALALVGGVLVAVCSLVTITNPCIPSTTLAWLDHRRRPEGIA